MPSTLTIPSSRPGHAPYTMRQSETGRWEHADLGCEAWQFNHTCHHVREAGEMERAQNEERGLVVRQENPLALMQAVDVATIAGTDLIVPDLKENGEHPWMYEFQQQGQTVRGLGVDGVEDAARALASKGEIIQEMECRLEMQDDREAYFISKAGRFAISPDGEHIGPLDTAIRALRQPKFIKLRDGGEKFNEKWFEVGVAKSNRNAKEALIPEKMKQMMIAIARDAKAQGQKRPAAPASRPGLDSAPKTGQPAPTATLRALGATGGLSDDYKAALRKLGYETLRHVPAEIQDLDPTEALRRLSGGA